MNEGMSRRSMLRTGAAAGTVAALGAAGLFSAGTANAAYGSAYPSGVTDTSHATPEIAALLRGVFTAKSKHDATAFMSYFSTTSTTYMDASLGLGFANWKEANDFFQTFLASAPPAAVSYPLRIVGDAHSASVEYYDVPEFFGHEILVLASVTFDRNHKITRWVDYWDGRSTQWPQTIPSPYPDFRDSVQNAGSAVVQAANQLQTAFAAGDAAAAAELMSADVAHEDLATHTRIRGRVQVQRYFARALGTLPYGSDAAVIHVGGNRQGGGYEWSASPVAAPLRRGHTAVELDAAGKISRLTAVYDTSVLSYPTYQSLVGLNAEAPEGN